MTTTAATLQAVFTADTSDFMRGSRAVDREMGNLGQRVGGTMQNMGQSITGFGTSMLTLTAPITAVFGLATRQAIQFESAFAGVEKTVDATDSELAALRATIRQMATDADNPLAGLENAHIAIANIMELGGQLGVATGDLDMFAQVIGELGMSTNLTTEEAAVMAAQFANISGMSFDDLDNFGSTIVALGNNSATTEKDIMSMASRIVAAGTQAGMSEQDILGFAATMSSLGLTAEMAGGNFSKWLGEVAISVAQGGDELENLATVAGLSADEFAAAWGEDATGAVNLFLQGLSGMDQAEQLLALEDLGVTGVEATRVLTSLAANTELLGNELEISNGSWEENNALTAEANARLDTAAARMNVFRNKVIDVGIIIGDALVPALIDGIEALEPFIEQIGAFAEQNPETIRSVATLVTALAGLATGAIAVGTAMSATGAIFGPVVGGVASLGKAFAALMPVISTFAGVFTGAMLPVLAVIAAGIAAGAALYLAWKNNFLGIQDLLAPVLDAVQNVIDGMAGFVDNAIAAFQDGGWDGLGDFLYTAAVDAFGSLVDGFKSKLDDIPGAVREYGPEILAGILLGLANIRGWVLTNIIIPLGQGLMDHASEMLAYVKEYGPEILEGIKSGLADGATWVVDNIVMPIATWISDNADEMLAAAVEYGPKILQGIVDGLGELGTWVMDNIIAPITGGMGDGDADIGAAATDMVETIMFEIGRLPGRIGAALIEGLPIVIQAVREYGPDILSGILTGLLNLQAWIFEHVVIPLTAGLAAGAIDMLNAVVEYGPEILAGILGGLGDLAMWVSLNILMPITNQIIGGAADMLMAVAGWGGNILQGILDGLGEIAAWVDENIIQPFVNWITGGATSVGESASSWGAELLASFLLGLGDLALWVTDNIVTPVTTALDGIITFIDGMAGLLQVPLGAVKGVFSTVFGGIETIIGGVIETLNSIVGVVEGIVGAILGIPDVANDVLAAVGGHANTDAGVDSMGLNNVFHMTGDYEPGLPRLYGTNMTNAMSAGQLQLGSSNKAGTPWTGSGSTSDVAGMVHMQEAVIPAGGMQVIPSPRGLMIEGNVQAEGGGGGGRTIVIQRLDVHGVQDVEQLFNELERIGMQRAAL